MGFEKFGVVTHMKESRAEEFVNYLEQGEVMATRCTHCEANYFPPQVDCPKCLVTDMEWFEIQGSGALLTYSTVHYGPFGFEDKAPYTLGVAEFAKGIRIFATLSRDIKESEVKVGMKVKVAPAHLADDKISYEFQAI